MESKKARRSFHNVLLKVMGVSSVDQIDFGRFPYWKEGALSGSTSLVGGYFLNFSSPWPTSGLLEVVSEVLGKNKNINQVIIPNVRRQGKELSSLGLNVKEVPCDPECIFECNGELIKELRTNVGGRYFSDLMRYYRRSRDNYTLKIYQLDDFLRNDGQLHQLDGLFNKHEVKYGHSVRIYGRAYLGAISMQPDLRDKFYVGVRTDKAGKMVQAMVLLMDKSTETIFFIAQAIDRSITPYNVNLYKAGFVDVYKLAELNGIKNVNLGRGSELLKRKLGANNIIPQSHFVFSRSQELVSF